MNKLLLSIFLLLTFSIKAEVSSRYMSLFGSKEMNGFEETKAMILTVSQEHNSSILLGMGVEFDPFFFSHNIPMNNGATVSDWDRIIVPRVKSMRIQRYRVWVLPQWWEPYNDNSDASVMAEENFTWDSYDMKSLYKVLDLAEETDADVNLVLWGCPHAASLSTGEKRIDYISRYFMTEDNDFWISGPKDVEEFAENFVALLKHLIIDCHYTCIREITPFNEPESRVVSPQKYIKCFKAIHRRLKKEGLRDMVHMVAADNIGTNQWFLQTCVDSLSSEADVYDSHAYSFGRESKNSDIMRWEASNVDIVSSQGKTHFLGEFGTNAKQQRDLETYERGVVLCRIAIGFLNAGCVGMSYWCLDDHFTNTVSSIDNMIRGGLWRYVNNVYSSEGFYSIDDPDYHVRPQYYAYSLLTRFVRRGDVVYPILMNDEYVSATAVMHTNGKWSYLFANSTDEDVSILLNNPNSQRRVLGLYMYRDNELPNNGKQISKSYRLKMVNSRFRVCIPNNSVIVLTE